MPKDFVLELESDNEDYMPSEGSESEGGLEDDAPTRDSDLEWSELNVDEARNVPSVSKSPRTRFSPQFLTAETHIWRPTISYSPISYR